MAGEHSTSEDAFERTPEALAGRALLDARLERLDSDARAAFWEVVKRCYGGPDEPDDGPNARV